MSRYEYEDFDDHQPEDYLRGLFITAIVLLMMFVVIGLQSCKAPQNVSYHLGCEITVKVQTKVYATVYDTVIDSTGIVEVMPQIKR